MCIPSNNIIHRPEEALDIQSELNSLMAWYTYPRNETLVHQQLSLHQLHHCYHSQPFRPRATSANFNLATPTRFELANERLKKGGFLRATLMYCISVLAPLTAVLHAGHIKATFYSSTKQVQFCYLPHS